MLPPREGPVYSPSNRPLMKSQDTHMEKKKETEAREDDGRDPKRRKYWMCQYAKKKKIQICPTCTQKRNRETVGAGAEMALRRGQSRACFQGFLRGIALPTQVVSTTETPWCLRLELS